MATTIKIKNSTTPGSSPSSLEQGEMALNVTDGRLFYGSGSGNDVKEFTGDGGPPIDTGSFATTGSNVFIGDQIITGSLTVSGSSTFTNITASGNISSSGDIFSSKLEITNTSLDDSLLITTTEDSDTAGPVFTFKRNSSSPDNGDYLGQIKFKGENDNNQEVVYAKITGKISDVTDTTEDGLIEFATKKAGSNVINARLTSTDLKLINSTGLEVNGSIQTDSTITAAGNISASGDVYGDTFIVNEITASGNISGSQNIYADAFLGERLRNINNPDDQIYFSGPREIILSVNGGDQIWINADQNFVSIGDLDLIIQDGKFVANDITSSANISASGTGSFGYLELPGFEFDPAAASTELVVNGDISASGNIEATSFTGSIEASNINGTIDISDQTNLSGGTNLTLSGDIMNLDANISLTNITASGNISGSQTGSFAYLQLPGFEFDSAAATTELVVNGDISASGNIEATSFTGSYQGTFTQVTGLTITSQSWGGAASLYSSSLSNGNILANSLVEVIPSNTDYSIVLAAQLLPQNSGSSGQVTVFAVNEPTDDINVTINIFN